MIQNKILLQPNFCLTLTSSIKRIGNDAYVQGINLGTVVLLLFIIFFSSTMFCARSDIFPAISNDIQ